MQIIIDRNCYPIYKLAARESLDEFFVYNITCLVDKSLISKNLNSKLVTINLYTKNKHDQITAYIQNFKFIGKTYDKLELWLSVSPLLYKLNNLYDCYLFNKQTLPTVLKTILLDIGYKADNIKLDLDATYSKLLPASLIQLPDESNWQFLQRIMQRTGCYITTANHNQILISNKPFAVSDTKTHSITMNPTIHLTAAYQQTIANIRVQDHPKSLGPNYNFSSEISNNTDSNLSQMWHDLACDSEQQARLLGQLIQQRNLINSHQLQITIYDRNIKLGDCIALVGNQYYANKYLVIASQQQARYAIKNHSCESTQIYQQKLTLVPFKYTYRPAINLKLHFSNLRFTARLISDTTLNNHGNYQIIPEFSKRIIGDYIIAPKLSTHQDLHFPAHTEHQAIVSFIADNIYRPIIIGQLPNQQQLGPVLKYESSQQILQHSNQQFLKFATAKQHKLLQLQNNLQQSIVISHQAPATITFQDNIGTLNLNAGTNLLQTGKQDIKFTSENNIKLFAHHAIQFGSKQQLQLHTNSQLNFSSRLQQNYLATNSLNIKTTNLAINCEQTMVINSQHTTVITVKNNSALLACQKKFNIVCKDPQLGKISFTIGDTDFTLTAAGTITIKAQQIKLNATRQLNVTGKLYS